MNNEKMNQIIDEAYENYNNYMSENFMETRWCKVEMSPDGKSITGRKCNRNEFIIESKTQLGFSEKWGLKIEERELSDGERLWICSQRHHIRFGTNDGPTWYNPDNPDRDKLKWMTEDQRQLCDSKNIPTKLITITYNNETIESYE
jgi:hypothetical protein